MRPKTFMSRYESARERAERIEQRIEWLESQKTSIQLLIDGMPRGTGSRDLQDRLNDLIVEVDDLRASAADDLAYTVRLRNEIENVIDRVSKPRLRFLLFQRYIECKTWMQIAADMGRMFKPDEQAYSEHWMIDLHSEALREVGKILNGKKK